jgi:hypothetical protein
MTTDTEIVDYQPVNLNGDIEGKCNHLLYKCRACGFAYQTSQMMTCPERNTDREYCSAWPEVNQQYCWHHGASSISGPDAGAWQGKGISKVLSSRLLASYQAHFEDPDILNMTSDISLLNMRRDALVEKWQEKLVSEAQWENLKNAYENLCDAINLGHQNKINLLLYNLGSVISDGYSDIMLWQEIVKIEEQITKIKEREIRRRKAADTVISENEFRRIFGFILSIIDSRVADAETKNQIFRDINRLNV